MGMCASCSHLNPVSFFCGRTADEDEAMKIVNALRPNVEARLQDLRSTEVPG